MRLSASRFLQRGTTRTLGDSQLSAVVDHPIVLVFALLLSAPFIWQLARSWFADIEQDAKDAVAPAIIDALGGPTIVTWLPLKIFWFSVVSAAIVITFYKVGAWIADW